MSRTPMRIAFITNDLEIGGAQQFLVSLIRALDRGRFAPHLATLSGQGVWVEAVRELGVEYFHAPAVRRAGSLRVIDPRALWALTRQLRDWRVDVVHTQLFLGNTLGRLAALGAGVPRWVATEHSTYFDHTRLQWWIDRRLARRTDRIVAVAEPVARHLVAGGIPAERIAVVPNGIALERFEKLPSRERARSDLGLHPDDFVLGSVARLTGEKSLEAILDLMPHLRARVPKVQLLIVGDGPQRRALVRRATEHGLESSVRLLGERSDVERILPALDLFVFPSRREGLPTALLEAMAAGVTPVVQDLPYARVVVEDGVDGCHIDFTDVPAAVDALTALARHPERRAALGAGAKRKAEQFSIRRTAEALSAIYLGKAPR
ncbi:MAG: glycosyltransferase [Deltaproteobacteria bacterium]|nr:glycosyltransferase [Deltaproteobacteria bacterium]